MKKFIKNIGEVIGMVEATDLYDCDKEEIVSSLKHIEEELDRETDFTDWTDFEPLTRTEVHKIVLDHLRREKESNCDCLDEEQCETCKNKVIMDWTGTLETGLDCECFRILPCKNGNYALGIVNDSEFKYGLIAQRSSVQLAQQQADRLGCLMARAYLKYGRKPESETITNQTGQELKEGEPVFIDRTDFNILGEVYVVQGQYEGKPVYLWDFSASSENGVHNKVMDRYRATEKPPYLYTDGRLRQLGWKVVKLGLFEVVKNGVSISFKIGEGQ